MTCFSLLCILASLNVKQTPLIKSVSETQEKNQEIYWELLMRNEYKCNFFHKVGNYTISQVPHIKGKTCYKLVLQPEIFDRNTSLQCKEKRRREPKNYDITFKSFQPPSNETNEITVKYYKNYINFDCSYFKNNDYSEYVHVARIYDNRLSVYKQWQTNFTEKYNGSILCCYIYIIKTTNFSSVVIKRYIFNKTLIITKDTVDVNTGIFYIAIGIELAIFMFITILTIICEKKTNWFTSTLSSYDKEDNKTTNQILYAELQLSSAPQTHNTRVEESPYAEIRNPNKLLYAELDLCHVASKPEDYRQMNETPYAQIINLHNSKSTQSKEESPYEVTYAEARF